MMGNLEFGVFDEGVYIWHDSVPQAVDDYERSFLDLQLEERLGFKYHFIIEHQGHVVGQLSHGRLEFGAGIGGSPDSFLSWNVPYSIPDRRFAGPEALDVILKAWTEDRFSYHGKYYQFDDVIPLPHPYQKPPHPPMWFAGRTKSSLELCVERGYGVGMFLLLDDFVADTLGTWRQLWKDSGKKEPRPPAFLTRSIYAAETDEQAYEEVAPYLPMSYSWGEEKFTIAQIGSHKFQNSEEPDSPDRQKGREIFTGMRDGIDFWLEHNLAYIGSPETVTRHLEETQKTLGYDVFGGRFRFTTMPDHLIENSLRLFGEKVIPQFKDVPVVATPAD